MPPIPGAAQETHPDEAKLVEHGVKVGLDWLLFS